MHMSSLDSMRRSRLMLYTGLAVVVGGAAPAARTSKNWVAASAAVQTPRISAFASVQSSPSFAITPSQAGVIAELDALPGQSLTAGQIIARLGGPRITAATIHTKAMLSSAQTAQHAAEISLATESQKLKQHLSTNQLVARAKVALATATAQTATAQANLEMLRRAGVLRSPLAGVVQNVAVANGALLAAGQVVATIQPDTGTWLRAVFYNVTAQDFSPDMTGLFSPADGGKPVPVTVRGAFGVSRADGGMPVALVAARALAPGMYGSVTLDLPKRTVILVPSDALILDKGQWWVMVHGVSGDKPVRVTPGAAEGYYTVITSGVTPGDDVVVVNAYLLYHRGVAALYQPPN